MEQDLVDKINSMESLEQEDRKHIGMENAITRLQMYYGDEGKVQVESQLQVGSTITIYIPIKK